MTRTRKLLRTLIVAVLVLGALAGVLCTGLSCYGRRVLDDEIAAWRAAGATDDLATLMPVRPTPGENASFYYMHAFDFLPERTDETSRVLDDPWTSEGAAALVGAYQEVLDEIRAAETRPHCVWPTDWGKGFAADLPYLMPASRASSLLVAEAAVRAGRGDLAGALASIEAGLILARDVARDPFLINVLLEAGIGRRMLDAYDHIFRSREAPPSRLEEVLDRIRIRESFRDSIRIEASAILMHHVRGDLPDMARGEEPDAFARCATTLLSGWLDLDVAYALGSMRAYWTFLGGGPAEGSPRGSWDRIEPMSDPRTGVSRAEPPWWARVAPVLMPSWAQSEEQVRGLEAAIALCRLANRLRAHQAEHGSYPEAFDTEADPFGGRPLSYRREGEGFVIASAGGPDGPIEWRWER